MRISELFCVCVCEQCNGFCDSYPDEQDLVSQSVSSLRQILDGELLGAVTGRVVLIRTILKSKEFK